MWPAEHPAPGHTSVPDIVYINRDGRSEELRYSLRSLKNLPHSRVHVVGGDPGWLSPDVHYVPQPQDGADKYENAHRNRTVAITSSEVADDFLLFNDDFFVMRPLERVPVLHRGPLAEVLVYYAEKHPDGDYTKGLRNTLALLTHLGIHDPLSYALHVPLPVHRPTAADLHAFLERLAWPGHVHWRTVYGNLARIGGDHADDVKVVSHDDSAIGALVSTNDSTFGSGLVGLRVRARLTEQCAYELTPPEGHTVPKFHVQLSRPLTIVFAGIRFTRGRATVASLTALQRLALKNRGATITDLEATAEAPEHDDIEAVPLEKMTRAQLDAAAAELGIDTSGAKNKRAVIALIEDSPKVPVITENESTAADTGNTPAGADANPTA